MILHDNLSSGNGYKVRLLLNQLGILFERIEYDIDRNETRTPEFLENVNPNGRIPAWRSKRGWSCQSPTRSFSTSPRVRGFCRKTGTSGHKFCIGYSLACRESPHSLQFSVDLDGFSETESGLSGIWRG